MAHDLGPCRLHALPLREERHDIPLYPSQQRSDGAVGGQRRLQARRRVRRCERRERHRRRADRVERRLRRRRGQPPPPLRGASRRRRRREPLPVPERRGAASLPRSDRRVVLARRARRADRRRRRDDHAPRDRGALVARRPVDLARPRAHRRARDGQERDGRSHARLRAREPGAARAAVADSHRLHRLHGPREDHGGRPSRTARRACRGPRHPPRRRCRRDEAGRREHARGHRSG